MFALFYSLYMAMFRGYWYNFDLTDISTNIKPCLNAVGTLATSIFGDFQMNTLGDFLAYDYLNLVSFILALITSIGIVVFTAKGIKRIFTIFFQGVR